MSADNSQIPSHQISLAQESDLGVDQGEEGELLDVDMENSENGEEVYDNDEQMYPEGEEGEENEHMNEEYEEGYDDGIVGGAEYNDEEKDEGELSEVNMDQMNDNTPKEHLSKVSELKEDLDEPEEIDSLPAERKVRFRVLRFINKLREKYNLLPFYNDPIGNKAAMAYAKYLLKDKENDGELAKYSKIYGYVGGTTYKVSNFSAFIDVSNDDGGKKNRYSAFTEEFLDAHSTLVEFEQHKNNLLSNVFNSVSFGCAFDEEKVVVVDIFNTRTLIIEEVRVNSDIGQVIIIGKMLNLKYGPFALRIVNEEAMNKELFKINVQNISYNRQTNIFRATFNNINNFIEEKNNKLIEVYLREKPETIVYEVAFEGFKIEDLTLGIRVPLEQLPHHQIARENEQEIQNETRRLNEEEKKKNEERLLEREENNRRKRAAEINKGELMKIPEMPEVDQDDEPKLDMDINKKADITNKENSKINKASDDHQSVNYEPSIDDIVGYNKKNYEQQLDDLEKNIEQLKRENEDLQRRICYIYDFSKNDKEDRNFYKDTNINESTYNDSLNSAANLYNELNTHRKKLAADEKRYHASIKVQEDRKRDVYEILMKYKEELIMNAEYNRKGSKIPDETIREWLETEKEYEEKIKAKRIENYKYSYELQRKTKELKKMEEYFEGLHLIDFEQLKIENNTLTEKIEDRNEEIHKLNNKINSNVQILAHLQEKLRFVENECSSLSEVENDLKKKLDAYKADLSSNKDNTEKNRLKSLNEKKKVESINSENLVNYYDGTNKNISDVLGKIQTTFIELEKFRKKQGKGINDLKILNIRAKELSKEYEDLKNNKF